MLSAAAESMLAAKVRHLPVVDAANRLVGLLNARGLTRILAVKLIDNVLTREQEQAFRLLEKAPFPVLISRIRDGHIRYCNPHFAKLLDMDREEMLNCPITGFYRDPSLRDTIVAQISSQGSIADQEMQVCAGNGEPRDVLVS